MQLHKIFSCLREYFIVVLGIALTYGQQRYNPAHVIDIATLTGEPMLG